MVYMSFQFILILDLFDFFRVFSKRSRQEGKMGEVIFLTHQAERIRSQWSDKSLTSAKIPKQFRPREFVWLQGPGYEKQRGLQYTCYTASFIVVLFRCVLSFGDIPVISRSWLPQNRNFYMHVFSSHILCGYAVELYFFTGYILQYRGNRNTLLKS